MSTALSIRQPWVELILRGRKTIEVRTWPTQYRGELWLHAGMARDRGLLKRFGMSIADVRFGALVGKCQLVDCIEFDAGTWETWRDQHLNEGPIAGRQFAWLLGNAARIEPRVMKGRLGLMKIQLEEGLR